MLFRRLLNLHFMELFEESSRRQSLNHGLTSFGLHFLFLYDAFHKVREKNFVCAQIVNQPIHKSYALKVQNVVIEMNLVGLGFGDGVVLDAQRFQDGVDFLVLHVLFIADFQVLLAKNLLDRISFILCNNLKVDQIHFEDEVFHFYYFLFGSLPVTQQVFFLGELRKPMAVDDVFENRTAVSHILVLLLEDALAKFEDDAESSLGLNQDLLTLVFYADGHKLALAIVDLLLGELNFHTFIVLLNHKRTFVPCIIFVVDRLGDVFFHIFLLIVLVVLFFRAILWDSLKLVLFFL